MPIAEEDRHYTTFLTPCGRFRYRACPQGFLASGDAFNARYDQFISDFKDKTKCIDDTLLWRENLEQSFFRTCEYLTLCSNAGIVFNLKKFQLGQQEVDFLGLRITMNSIRSNPEYLEAITNFHDQGTSKGYAVGLALCNRWLMPFHRLILCYPFVTY